MLVYSVRKSSCYPFPEPPFVSSFHPQQIETDEIRRERVSVDDQSLQLGLILAREEMLLAVPCTPVIGAR